MAKNEPTWIQWLERMEPYVANRLLLVQGGLALALSIAGAPQGSIPEVLNFLPFSLGGVVRESLAFDVGYPIRELIWAGEIWRIPIGTFLPPGMGIFLLYWLSMIPFAKALETRLPRTNCFLVYTIGGVATVGIDLMTGTGVTSGGIGMVFSAAGALWTLDRLAPPKDPQAATSMPRQNAFFLILLGLICALPYWGQPQLEGEMAQLGIAILTPSLAALGAAFLTGVFMAPFLISTPAEQESSSSDSIPPPVDTVARKGNLWIGPAVAGISVLGYGVLGWYLGGRVDQALWRLEPELMADSQEGTDALARLVERYPDDLFLQKRLAVHHLRAQRWNEAEPVLAEVRVQSASWTSQAFSGQLLRALRLAHLNLRDSGTRVSWSYSGLSVNYQVLPEWVIIDQAHLVRLKGDEENLTLYRRKVLEMNENLIRAQVEKKASAGDPLSKPRIESLILNERAYLRTELDGNLAVAIEEASRSVALHVDSNNLDTLGWVHFKSGETEKAIENLGRSLQAQETSASGTTYYHLGAAFQASGDEENARFYFKEALRRDLPWWELLEIERLCPDCAP
jgi:tetratricopeptide (TPR) repeat protein